jgi:hypothetical protein
VEFEDEETFLTYLQGGFSDVFFPIDDIDAAAEYICLNLIRGFDEVEGIGEFKNTLVSEIPNWERYEMSQAKYPPKLVKVCKTGAGMILVEMDDQLG